MEIDPFKELPDTRQGLSLYVGWGQKEIKRIERKKNKLEKCIDEARRRLGVKQEDVNATISANEESKNSEQIQD